MSQGKSRVQVLEALVTKTRKKLEDATLPEDRVELDIKLVALESEVERLRSENFSLEPVYKPREA